MNKRLAILFAALAGLVFASGEYPRRVPPGLVMGHTYDHQDARDSTEYGNSGTLIASPTLASGVLPLNGSTQYVTVPDAAELRVDQFTLAAWVKPVSPGTSARAVVGKYGSTGLNKRSYILFARYDISPQAWSVQVVSDGAGVSAGTLTRYDFTVPPASGWTHVVATYDRTRSAGQRVLLWVNGVSQATTSIPVDFAIAPHASDISVSVGSQLVSGGAASHWAGSLEDVRIYDRALTTTEVLQLYQDTRNTARP